MRKNLHVSSHGTQWKVHWENESNGQMFNIKTDAIREAKRMVAALPAGNVSAIKVQDDRGMFQTEWTYGRDPFPPRG